MAVTVCPIALVNAPIDIVWQFLASPAEYAAWTDAEFLRAEPSGAAAEGQKIFFRTRALGRWWPVVMEVGTVDPPHGLELRVQLPLGIINSEHINVLPLGRRETRVSFN